MMVTRSQARNLNTNTIELHPGTHLPNTEQQSLRQYHQMFKQKEFILSQSQGIPTSVTANAYENEQTKFLQTCKRVHVSQVPSNSNVISSHVLYKIKQLDDDSLMCKARIARTATKTVIVII